jgi:hypothetical protein
MKGMKYAVHENVEAVMEKPEAIRPLERSQCKRENNIERILKKCDGKVFQQVMGALL